MAKSRKRRKDGWALFLLFWTLLLLTAGFVICVFFYLCKCLRMDTLSVGNQIINAQL